MTRLFLSATEPPPKARSKASQIAELLPEIEAALAAGHSHQAIFEQVKNTTGLTLTFGYYENTLHRVRQKRGEAMQASKLPTDLRQHIVQAASAATSRHTMPATQETPPTPKKFTYDVKSPIDDFTA